MVCFRPDSEQFCLFKWLHWLVTWAFLPTGYPKQKGQLAVSMRFHFMLLTEEARERKDAMKAKSNKKWNKCIYGRLERQDHIEQNMPFFAWPQQEGTAALTIFSLCSLVKRTKRQMYYFELEHSATKTPAKEGQSRVVYNARDISTAFSSFLFCLFGWVLLSALINFSVNVKNTSVCFHIALHAVYV